MRLICPNCDAQYEVDASMIPASGRDVQCSNCGRTWFQPPEGQDDAQQQDLGRAAPEPDFQNKSIHDAFADVEDEADTDPDVHPVEAEIAAAEPEAEPEPEPEPVLEPEPEPAPEPEPDTSDDDAPDEDDAPYEPPADLEPRRHDEEVLNVLREEASREIEARRAEAAAPQEEDVNLGASASAAIANLIEEESHTAKIRGADEPEPANEGPRRDLLPDIDEINSTLTSTSDRPIDASPEEVFEQAARHRSGFRVGFSLILLIVAALIGLYSFADSLAEAVPSLQPMLAAYVDWANSVRIWFDGLIGSAVDGLAGLIVSVTGSS